MPVEPQAERDAWALHLAGGTVLQVATATGLTVARVRAVIKRRAPLSVDGEGPEVELARINELWRNIYPRAREGDPKMQSSALKLSERRLLLSERITVLRKLSREGRPQLVDVNARGNERDTLVALSERLAAAVITTRNASEVASLAGRMQDVLERIAQLDERSAPVDSRADEIAERRRRRKPIKDGVAREQA